MSTENFVYPDLFPVIAEHGERGGKDTTFSFQFCLPTGVVIKAEPASREHHPYASRALGSVRFTATDSLTDFVSPISGSVSSYMWPFSRQVRTAADTACESSVL